MFILDGEWPPGTGGISTPPEFNHTPPQISDPKPWSTVFPGNPDIFIDASKGVGQVRVYQQTQVVDKQNSQPISAFQQKPEYALNFEAYVLALQLRGLSDLVDSMVADVDKIQPPAQDWQQQLEAIRTAIDKVKEPAQELYELMVIQLNAEESRSLRDEKAITQQ